MDRTSVEFHDALLKVSDEYSTWTAGRIAVTAKELLEWRVEGSLPNG